VPPVCVANATGRHADRPAQFSRWLLPVCRWHRQALPKPITEIISKKHKKKSSIIRNTACFKFPRKLVDTLYVKRNNPPAPLW
jgi:hypothetical protein